MKKLIDCLQVGSKVFDVLEGWGVVTYLDCDCISVQFNNTNGDDYESDGRKFEADVNPSLFLNEITLEQELPEFMEGEIVLVQRGYGWVVGKYLYKKDNKHCVDIIGTGSYSIIVDTVKSFDISYFVK